MPTISDPFSFRNGVTAKNRIWMAPLTNQQSHEDGSLSEDEFHWLDLRVKGGFGVIETCASHVSKDGQGWPGELGVFDDSLLPGLTRLAHSIETGGARGLVQIFHGGMRAPSRVTGLQPWSASELLDGAGVTDSPRAATEEDIHAVIERFKEAAVRCHRAGFSGVELHGAHGYLLGQFLSTTYNRRTDAWGGSLPGRARLMREVVRAVRGAVPAGFVVGIRISPEDFGQAKGHDLDESIQVAKWLSEDGIDFLHLSLWDTKRNSLKRPAEHPIPLFRHAIPSNVIIVVAGGIWTAADADEAFAKGADAVALGKGAIGNPDWALQTMNGGWEPKRPPFTVAELRARGLNETFAGYMRNWKGFVREE